VYPTVALSILISLFLGAAIFYLIYYLAALMSESFLLPPIAGWFLYG
jgi:hypothetical protein